MKIDAGVALAQPAVGKRIWASAFGVRVRLVRLLQPHPPGLRVFRVPPPLPTAPMIGIKVILAAVIWVLIARPEREAAVDAVPLSHGWNEGEVPMPGGSHDAI